MNNYGMFTEAGNAIVSGVVCIARTGNVSWDCVLQMLANAASIPGCEEACDTEVRECVYKALYEVTA